MKDTWRGFSRNQKGQLVAVFALVLGLPMILGGVYSAKIYWLLELMKTNTYTGNTPNFTTNPSTYAESVSRRLLLCGTYGPSCDTNLVAIT